jgi:hypothetical protein
MSDIPPERTGLDILFAALLIMILGGIIWYQGTVITSA